jgi:hypothetical protein
MKYFSILCFSLMAAAGSYGTFDLIQDLSNGTMIRYDHGGPSSRQRTMNDALRSAFDPKVRVSSFYIDESEFSRGDGMYNMGETETDSTQYDFTRDINAADTSANGQQVNAKK